MKKTHHKKPSKKKSVIIAEPAVPEIKLSEPSSPAVAVQHHDKKKVLFKGIIIHLLSYALLGIIMSALGVPNFIVLAILMVLVWGLFVLSYAYYYHK